MRISIITGSFIIGCLATAWAQPKGTRKRGTALKQATRKDIIARATRTEAKRATVSGTYNPSANPPETFVMMAQDSGYTYLDGRYAVADTTGNWPTFTSLTTSNAETFYLDSNGFLYTSSGLTGYADSEIPGNDHGVVYFGQEDANAGAGQVQCTVSNLDTLSCVIDDGNPNTALYTMGVCITAYSGGQYATLGFNYPGKTDCTTASIYIYEATP